MLHNKTIRCNKWLRIQHCNGKSSKMENSICNFVFCLRKLKNVYGFITIIKHIQEKEEWTASYFCEPHVNVFMSQSHTNFVLVLLTQLRSISKTPCERSENFQILSPLTHANQINANMNFHQPVQVDGSKSSCW